MAQKHKLTAIKATGAGDDMVINLMTRSSRGTQVIYKTLKVNGLEGDRALFKSKLEAALELELAIQPE